MDYKLQEKSNNLPIVSGGGDASQKATDDWVNGRGDDFQGSWASAARKYEWTGEYGEIGPPDPELEEQLFRSSQRMEAGQHLQVLTSIDVNIEGKIRPAPIVHFADAGLHPAMLENVKLASYKIPTPIQAYVIPAILAGHDVVACAQTGSGKTAAYLIPVLSKLMGKAKTLCAPRPVPGQAEAYGFRAEPLVVVVVPTRELAVQIFKEACRLCYRSMLRPCVVYGGATKREQALDLRNGCDILIGTPGRLCDFMLESNTLTLSRLKFTVIDEADEMLDADWDAELRQILTGGDTNEDSDHVYMMFSATFPKQARALARDYMAEEHVRIRVGRPGSTHGNIVQHILEVDAREKQDKLLSILNGEMPFLPDPAVRTMIFVNDIKTVERLDEYLFHRGFPVTSIHGKRTQREREDASLAFRTGRTPLLITTGVSARGIDIRSVMHVINYDLPREDHGGIEEYTHRIGRTGRIGNQGVATAFYCERDAGIAESLVKLLIEAKQEVPEFLESFRPAGDVRDFHNDDNSDNGSDKEGGVAAFGNEETTSELGGALEAAQIGTQESSEPHFVVSEAPTGSMDW